MREGEVQVGEGKKKEEEEENDRGLNEADGRKGEQS